MVERVSFMRSAGASSKRGSEALELLQDYISCHMRFDSYGVAVFDQVEDLFEVTETRGRYGKSYSVVLHLPANLLAIADLGMCRRVDCVCPQEAKRSIAEDVVQALVQGGWLREEEKVLDRDTPEQRCESLPSFDQMVSDYMRELRLPGAYSFLGCQGARSVQVGMYLVEGREQGYGFVTAVHGSCNHQLRWGDVELRLDVVRGFECNEADIDVIRSFHRQCVSVAAADEQAEVLLVTVRDGSIDVEMMKRCATTASFAVPDWVPWLSHVLQRLTFWEAVCAYSPIMPSPSPTKLEKIFDRPDECRREQFEADLQCMVMCGRTALEHIAAVAESVREPGQCRAELERKVHEYLRADVLANLLCTSSFMGLGTRELKDDDAEEDMKDMILALLGAQMLDSDVFGVTQLWEWFLQSANQCQGKVECSSLMIANRNTASCPVYRGRTPSYVGLGEVDPESEEEGDHSSSGPSCYLRVSYEDYDDSYYRWKGFVAQERRPEISSQWKPIVLDTLSGSLCSPSMKYLSNGGDWKPCPLPSKCSAWLRGRPLAKLAGVKHGTERTQPYEYLREEELEEEVDGRQVMSTCLYVFYKHQNMEVFYRRSRHGGLGLEYFQGRRHHVTYSEARKVLVSEVMAGWALPRKVVHWLLDRRCLADIISLRIKISSECTKENGVASYASSHGYRMYVRASAVGCKGTDARAGAPGIILQCSTDECKWIPLTYAEESKDWVICANRLVEEPIPWEAVRYVTSFFRHPAEGVRFANDPAVSRAMFPNTTGTAVAELTLSLIHI